MRDLRDVSEEMSLDNLPVDVSEIYQSALFEMSLRRCIRCLKGAYEMHACGLGWCWYFIQSKEYVKEQASNLQFYERETPAPFAPANFVKVLEILSI